MNDWFFMLRTFRIKKTKDDMKILKMAAFFLLLLIVKNPAHAQTWSLDSCIAYAQKHNLSLLASTESLKASEIQKKSSIAQLVPEITANANIDNYWQIPVQVLPGELIGQPGKFIPVRMGTPWMGSYGLEASLKLVDVQSWQNIRLAALQNQAKQSEISALQKALSRNVSMAFYAVQQQQQNVKTTAELLENYREIHRLLSLQFEKGFTDKIAFNQSLNILKEREEAFSKSKHFLEQAYMDLKFWMGFPLENELKISGNSNIPTLQNTSFSESNLPDYQWQKMRVEVSRQQYKNAYSSLYPSLRINSAYRQLGFGENINFITENEWFPSAYVGLQLRVPIFSLGNMAYNPAIQKHFWRQADMEFSSYQEGQKKNFMREQLLLDEALESMKNREEQLLLAQENERLTKQKIEKGLIDMIQLKQVEQDLQMAQEKLSEARINYIKHYTELQYLQNK